MPKQTTNTPTTQSTARTPAAVRPAPVRANQAGAEALVQRAMADPASLTAQDVVLLQRHLGNHTVQGLLSRSAPAAPAPASVAAPAVQRAPAEAELETEPPAAEAIEAAGGAADTARPSAPPPDDDDPLQRSAAAGGVMGLAGGPVEDQLADRVQRARSGGQALPAPVRTRMEGAFQTDFSGVKVHTDGESHALNQSLGARAFTTGPDIFFKEGEYQPAASDGQELLAHELTHVVQQGGALRRKPNFMGAAPTKLGGAVVQRAGDDEERPTAPTVAPTDSVADAPAPTEEPVTAPTGQVSPTSQVDDDDTEVTIPELDAAKDAVEDEADVETDDATESESESESGPTEGNVAGPSTDTDAEPSTAPPSSPVPVNVQLPVYPDVLTTRTWDKNKGFAAKLGRDDIGIQIGIVSSAHRGVLWDRFNIGRFPPEESNRTSESTNQTAQSAQERAQAAKLAAKAATPAALRAATRALNAAKEAYSAAQTAATTAIEDLETALASTRREYSRNVVLLMGQLQMLNTLLLAKQAKSQSGKLNEMLTSLVTYKNQAAAVQIAFQAYEAALTRARDLEAEAKQALAAFTKDEEDAEDEADAETETEVDVDAVELPSDSGEVESPELDAEESESNAPVTGQPESVVTAPTGQSVAPQGETTTTPDVDTESTTAPLSSSVTPPTVKRVLPTLPPRTARGVNPAITIPAYPTLFNEREWDRNKGMAAKLGRDTIGIQLGIVSSAHRGVLWDRFNLGRFPPNATPVALAAEAAADAARSALAGEGNPRGVAQARTALTQALETAKTAVEDADGVLALVKTEFRRNVVVLVGQTQMLHQALVAQAAKSNSDYLNRMAVAAAAYAGQVGAVQAAIGAYEQALDYARNLEAEATRALEELADGDDDDGDLFGGLSSVDVTDTGDPNAPDRKPISQMLSGKFFVELDRVRFYKEPDAQQWLNSPDLTVSAKDNKTRNGLLASLQTKGKFNLLAFKDSTVALKNLRTQSMSPALATQKINLLVGRATAAYGERAGFVGVHRQWQRQQLSLAGGQSKYDEWADKFPKAAKLHERLGEVLLSDQDAVEGISEQAAQIRR